MSVQKLFSVVDVKVLGPSGNAAATRFQLQSATSHYDFSPDENLC